MQIMLKMQVAIDGPAGSGKSTAARQVAKQLGYLYIDTGALYRAVALVAVRQGVDLNDSATLANLAKSIDLEVRMQPDGSPVYFIAGKEVTDALRSPEINDRVSQVAKLAAVRERVTEKLQALGDEKGIVMDGRDIGTVVLPSADIKVFLTADLATRVQRRQQELSNRGFFVSAARVEEEVRQRDREDANRQVAPLKPAPDACVVDTTNLNPEEVVSTIVELAKQRAQNRTSQGRNSR